MECERFSTDELEQQLVERQARIDGELGGQLAILEEMDRRQVATGDGSRNLSEWVAARLDIGLDSARQLVRTMRRTSDRPQLRQALATGVSTLDRLEALSQIPDEFGLMDHLDVAGIRREAAKRARITAEDESRTADDRFLVMQPSLDESWWKVWGGLDGHSGAIVDKVLTEAADHLPQLPEGEKTDSSWRKATALVGLCVSGEPVPAQITVIVDADPAARSDGEAGIMLEAGPKVGQDALQAILCDAVTEVTVNTNDGVLMSYGHKSRTAPPALRRAVLARSHGYCAVPGCNSRYRVEIHHKTPWSHGGTTDPENLVALCWFHHQVVVHQRGFNVMTEPATGRIRLVRPPPDSPDSPD